MTDVQRDRQTEIHTDIATYRMNRPKGRFSENNKRNQETLGKNHQSVFGTQLIRVPPGGQQPAPQPAPLPGPGPAFLLAPYLVRLALKHTKKFHTVILLRGASCKMGRDFIPS